MHFLDSLVVYSNLTHTIPYPCVCVYWILLTWSHISMLYHVSHGETKKNSNHNFWKLLFLRYFELEIIEGLVPATHTYPLVIWLQGVSQVPVIGAVLADVFVKTLVGRCAQATPWTVLTSWRLSCFHFFPLRLLQNPKLKTKKKHQLKARLDVAMEAALFGRDTVW